MVAKLLYFDIETAGRHPDLAAVEREDPWLHRLFLEKHSRRTDQVGWNGTPGEAYLRQAGLLAEYGVTVCASFGYDDGAGLRIRTFSGTEEEVIRGACSLFSRADRLGWRPCGFNVKNFDVPWINKKCRKYGIPIPDCVDFFEKKPWEVRVLDLAEVWNCTFGKFASFDEMCHELGLTSPKEDLSGKDVHSAFWRGEVKRIVEYCESDVRHLALASEKILPKE